MSTIDMTKPVWRVLGQLRDGRRVTVVVDATDRDSLYKAARRAEADLVVIEDAFEIKYATGLRKTPETPATPRDWPAFWRSLPPREQWEAAKAMPKIAEPWAGTTKYGFRRDVATRKTIATFGVGAQYPDRASADDALRAAGWVLVDD